MLGNIHIEQVFPTTVDALMVSVPGKVCKQALAGFLPKLLRPCYWSCSLPSAQSILSTILTSTCPGTRGKPFKQSLFADEILKKATCDLYKSLRHGNPLETTEVKIQLVAATERASILIHFRAVIDQL